MRILNIKNIPKNNKEVRFPPSIWRSLKKSWIYFKVSMARQIVHFQIRHFEFRRSNIDNIICCQSNKQWLSTFRLEWFTRRTSPSVWWAFDQIQSYLCFFSKKCFAPYISPKIGSRREKRKESLSDEQHFQWSQPGNDRCRVIRVAEVEGARERRPPKGQGLLRKEGPPTYTILSRNLVLSRFTRFLKGFHRAFN